MIGLLRGTLLEKRPPMLLLDVQGVGYELEAPMTTFYQLPSTGSVVTLHTHLLVREDAQLLYAFSDLEQRNLFRSLLRVNGVGPRVALAILSGLSAREFQDCVLHGDTSALIRVPGIGRKTAERLLVEMRDRLAPSGGDAPPAEASASTGDTTPARDAVSALVALGYKAHDAARVVRPLENQGLTREDMIRRALQTMGAAAS